MVHRNLWLENYLHANKTSNFVSHLYWLDKISNWNYAKNILVTGSQGTGLTAICLDICKLYSNNSHPILYFDFQDSLYVGNAINYRRIPDFENNMVIVRTTGSSNLLELIKDISYNHRFDPIVFCFDSADILSAEDDLKIKRNLESLRSIVSSLFSKATIIITEKSWKYGWSHGEWSNVLICEKEKLITENREILGHTCNINSLDGKSAKVFLDYKVGRIHQGFDMAQKEVLEFGVSPNSLFTYNNVSYHGIWNVVKEGFWLKQC